MISTQQSLQFTDIASIEQQLISASAQNLGGMLVRQDYNAVIGDYRTKETVLWQMLSKVPAASPKIQEIRRAARPVVSWVNRADLSGAPNNSQIGQLLDDPGQDVKAIAGILEIEHFARSMVDQQGRLYGDQVAKDTDDLIVSALRFLERSLIRGDSSIAGGLQFNGITRQMATNHSFTANITTPTPDKVHDKLDEICMRASMDVDVLRKITHIFCSGAGARLLTKEMKDHQIYQNVREISPGVQVPSILTAYGMVPIVPSPYISDLDGGAGNDTINYWLIDLPSVEWHGVFPYGGTKTFEPQIFDVSNIVNGQPLLDKRFVLLYGTPYCKNLGQGIYKLEVTAPPGTTFNNG